ncbi:hypothetical protein ABC502_04335 [Alkalimonas sp. NCh-2]|uniref:hypothetical protein n=1 Tax=Alkalimonas sp. NCh-2 TaxID=3144846 RepID=UPI0031F61768
MPTFDEQQRLAFLIRVIKKERTQLEITQQRLFSEAVTAKRLQDLERDPAFSEQLDAFASRFARLQDNVGDKLLPATLLALGEPKGPVLDNLNKAERFGWLDSAENWLLARQLRNKMVHEYIEDLTILADALNTASQFSPMLHQFAEQLIRALSQRNLLPDSSDAS